MKHWLMKTEPEVFSIDDLKRLKISPWDGVRNYQARNFMMKEMAIGDAILLYHSNAEPPGVAGLARVASAALPDKSQFAEKSEYFDPKATREKPIWFAVTVAFKEKFPRLVSLAEIRAEPNLSEILVAKKGQRLSIQPVTAQEFAWVCQMARA